MADAAAELKDALAIVEVCHRLLSEHEDLMHRFMLEAERMDSVGPILDPSLFMNSERRAAEAVVKPVFEETLRFLATIRASRDRAAQALAKVKARG